MTSQKIEDEDQEKLHELGDTEAYDRAIRSVHVGLVGFALNDKNGEVLKYNQGVAVEGAFACMRANQFAEGSRTIEDVEDGEDGEDGEDAEDAAARLGVTLGMAILVTGAAIGVLL